jgi:tetratricopeptide (TPR) repeat protein
VQRFPKPGIRSAWIAGTASNLIAIGLLQNASDLLGGRADNDSPSILEARASLAAAKGHWNDAETLARASLSGDSRRSASRIILVRALTETGRTTEALEEAGHLVSLREDQESLFLLARAASAAGDRVGEIEALEKLVLLGRRDHQSLGASLTYLGQAYGKAGRRGDAMRSLEEALRSPELDDSQKEAVRQLLEHLKPDAPATEG